jgi:hypothetical protein
MEHDRIDVKAFVSQLGGMEDVKPALAMVDRQARAGRIPELLAATETH